LGDYANSHVNFREYHGYLTQHFTLWCRRGMQQLRWLLPSTVGICPRQSLFSKTDQVRSHFKGYIVFLPRQYFKTPTLLYRSFRLVANNLCLITWHAAVRE
jgi:hypothetical protein